MERRGVLAHDLAATETAGKRRRAVRRRGSDPHGQGAAACDQLV
jgi:hypothetical protein